MPANQKATPLEKRIKRRVTAREHDFFIVTAPGLSNICQQEMKTRFPEKTTTQVDGGIKFRGSVRDCYSANLHLRTASRILMRIGSLTATSFSILEKKLSDFPWELYLTSGRNTEVNVSVKKSKLIHSEAIAERFKKNISERLPDNGSADSQQTIFIRGFNDRFVISIDSSGELLYKRGIKTKGGKAPVRETIAAFALMLAGYDGNCPLIDPMCGSGTFSLEAAMIQKSIPPGWFRQFAFEAWPCFRQGTWLDLRRHAESNFTSVNEKSIFASDIDQEACMVLEETIKETEFNEQIHISHSDFFTLKPENYTDHQGIVIINPPYGLRLGSSEESEEAVRRIIEVFEKDYKGWRLAMLSPFTSFMKSSSLNLKKYPVSHGGLKLFLVIGQ